MATTASEVPPWAAGTTERMSELYPELTDEDIETLKGYGRIERYAEGETLWQPGDRGPFMAVLRGGIDIYTRRNDDEQIIIQHGPRHYVGEIITMSGGQALVAGRANADLEVVFLESDQLRRLIATEAELGERLLLSFILRRMRMVAERLTDIVLIGQTSTPTTADLLSFLSRNGIPFETLDPDRDPQEVDAVLAANDLSLDDLPAVITDGRVLKAPSNRTLAEDLGFTAEIDCGVTYDVAVVGSGPAGMAAAVYAASEGLSVIVFESCAPGGQAGSSSKIENYVGFPTGISGQALMGRAYIQAQKFGAQIAVAREIQSLECGEPLHKLRIDGGDIVYARAVVIASGAVYRQPAIDGLDGLGGVHYGAGFVEGELCRGQDIAIIGGGNSAGQAAVYLSRRARKVYILIRGADLSHSMSDYLIQRIDSMPNVELRPFTEVVQVNGESRLESVTVRQNHTGDVDKVDITHLFIFIGAQPGTDFVGSQVALDDKGFVLTGDQLDEDVLGRERWSLERSPYPLETSCPRIFAAGDVRSGSVKRVASAVGEGSVCVQQIHRAIADSKPGD